MTNTFQERGTPLRRWDYFVKTLYQNTARMPEFTYHGVIYRKTEELRRIDQKSSNINYLLILAFMVLLLFSNLYHNNWLMLGFIAVAIAVQVVRYFMLPRDIMVHLTDTGRRAY